MSEEHKPFLAEYKESKDSGGGELKVVTDTDSAPVTVRLRRKPWIPATICFVAVLLVVLLVSGICIGLYAVPRHDKTSIAQEICANPPVLLVSMDGFRVDYLDRNLTPNLQNLINTGVKAAYMRSSFPTLTFPNHYSIVTGLYPESHGMVNNLFYDSELKEKFTVAKASETKWWGGEPVWITAVKNKLIAGVYYWPGSEAEIEGRRPNYWFPYKITPGFSERVDTVLGWLDLPKEKRPQFIAMYFNEPDHTGHTKGPDSPELNKMLGVVDEAIGRLWEGLQNRSISGCVNLMLVSDHGMSPTNFSRVLFANQIVPSGLFSNISFSSFGPVMNIDISGGNETVELVYQSFVKNGTDLNKPFRAFHTENLPLRLHTGHFYKQRFGPVFLIADDHAYLRPTSPPPKSPPAGNHGYDNIEKTLRATFIAHGPAFKQNYVAPPIENVQLYSLMCELLDITAAPNNGTVGSLRHILNPQVVGKFSPPKASEGSPGVVNSCQFPQDNSTLVQRSLCEECVCNSACNASNSVVLASNKDSFNHTGAEETQFQQLHFPWGVPLGGRGSGACLLWQSHFVHLYSNSLHIPLLVGYRLMGKVVSHIPEWCLRRDPRIVPANSANCSHPYYEDDLADKDFVGGLDYDEGMDEFWKVGDEDPLSPVSWILPTNASGTSGLSTSVLSAVVPLRMSFIRDVWTPVRLVLSDWLRAYGTLHVMVGSVMDADRDGLRDPDSTYPKVGGVAVPSHVFVVVTRCGDSAGTLESCNAADLEVLGLLFQHPLETGDYSDSSRVLRYALTPLRDIERVSGFNFFPTLSAEQQNLLELRLLDELWPSDG